MDQNNALNLQLTKSQVSERDFISSVYFWMSAGLAMTGLVAWWMAASPNVVISIMSNPVLFFGIMLTQIGLVVWLSAAISKIQVGTAVLGYSLYALLNGVLFSSIFLVYTAVSIATTFFVTAGTFAALSLYGYTTKRDLTSVGSFCFMALIGVILASIANLFLHNATLYWVVTYAGLAVFVGLTAYDVQRLKAIHQQGFQDHASLQKMALIGALRLYLDFVNMFLLLIRITGRRR